MFPKKGEQAREMGDVGVATTYGNRRQTDRRVEQAGESKVIFNYAHNVTSNFDWNNTKLD